MKTAQACSGEGIPFQPVKLDVALGRHASLRRIGGNDCDLPGTETQLAGSNSVSRFVIGDEDCVLFCLVHAAKIDRWRDDNNLNRPHETGEEYLSGFHETSAKAMEERG